MTCAYRSVHNTRIERLWYDVTHGFGKKWKDFFISLEASHGLNPSVPEHIWLLHHLFLSAIDRDAQEWAEAWNSHQLQIRGERSRSPRDMFLFSLLQDGPRGIHTQLNPPEDHVENIAAYGIDWDVASDPALMDHLLQNNPHDLVNANPFDATGPARLSDVPCEPPNCPFTEAQVEWLDDTLTQRVNMQSRNMDIRRVVWIEALSLCAYLVDQVDQL